MTKLFEDKEPKPHTPSISLEKIEQFFRQEHWQIEPAEQQNMLGLYFAGVHGDWPCIAHLTENHEIFVFVSVFPQVIEKEYLDEVMKFITRANFGLLTGNFELDLDDGELRFKTSINTRLIELSHPVFEYVVYENVTIFDDYLPALLRVSQGNITASAVFRNE